MPAGDQPPVKVGVQLAPPPEELGEWLADASAFDAAGAAALWLDPGSAPDVDPLALLAALAAITSRSLLVAALPEPGREPGALARTLATIGRLSHGRLALVAGPAEVEGLASAGAAGAGLAVFRLVPEAPGELERLPSGDEQAERWVRAPAPEGREAWRAALAAAAEQGARGLLVPAGPRLLDILRNPNDPGGRGDLQLAQG
jgi:Luciferase-like monooxygenase